MFPADLRGTHRCGGSQLKVLGRPYQSTAAHRPGSTSQKRYLGWSFLFTNNTALSYCLTDTQIPVANSPLFSLITSQVMM